MTKRGSLFPKVEGILPYVSLLYLILPIANIATIEKDWGMVFGYLIIGVFLIAYREIYWAPTDQILLRWIGVLMGTIMVLAIWNTPYNIYMGLYLGFFIGWITDKHVFNSAIAMLIMMLAGTVSLILLQYPEVILFEFIPITLIMIATAFGIHHFNKKRALEKELDKANEQVKELVQKEERHRIARDLHDTLGHTLSLITLQSQLVERLIKKQPEKAMDETKEIETASRTALKQVRELVSSMRTLKMDEEIKHMEQIVTAAGVHFAYKGMTEFSTIEPLVQNMIGMCIRESGTNIVKHSQATKCSVAIQIEHGMITIQIWDDGVGIGTDTACGNGLHGMKERLAFIEGDLVVASEQGTCLTMMIPLVSRQKEASL